MTPIEPSDEKAGHAGTRPEAGEAARSDARQARAASPQVIASVWKEAHALYLALRREYAATGPEIANFDNAWSVWTANPPNPSDPEALAHANRALLFYKKAAYRVSGQTQAQRGSERLAFAHRALPPYWDLGADLARVADTIAATRPAAPQTLSDDTPAVPVGTADEWKTHLDTVEARLAKVLADLAAIRRGIPS